VHRAPGTAKHQAPSTTHRVYEQFAETILSEVTFSVGIAEAGVAVPRALALAAPGDADEPGEVDEPGRSAVPAMSVVP